MILSKFVTITLHHKNIKLFESLGYEIPRYKPYHNRNKMWVKQGTQIKVKVKDLLSESNIKVLCKCDNIDCKSEPILITYQKHNKRNDGKYLCKSCSKIGSKHSNETKQKMSNYRLSHPYNEKEKRKRSEKISGQNNPMWNPNLTYEDRNKKRSKIWSSKVKQRDNYTCQNKNCKFIGKPNDWIMTSHHIENFAENKDQRLKINNGITLCKKCHINFHKKFGKKTNKKDLEKFLS